MKKFSIFLFILIFTINSSFGMFQKTNAIAPTICQRLLKFGEKIFEMEPQPPIKMAKGAGASAVCDNIHGKEISQIYALPSFFSRFRTYGFRKGTMLHELTHARQHREKTRKLKRDPFSVKFPLYGLPLNPDYPHIETEADMEAIKHIACWKCAQEYGRTRMYTNDPLRKIFYDYPFAYYATWEMVKPIIEVKRKIGEECDYHKTLRSHIPYILSNFIPPTITFCLSLSGLPIEKSKLIATGYFSGLVIQYIIQKAIEMRIEDKVASGELEP